MLFSSLEFWLFFVVVLGLHWSLPHRFRNLLLLAVSYVFYAAWDWRFLGLILLSTAVDYGAARVIGSSERSGVRRTALVSSLLVNVGLLAFFKYYNFFVTSLDELLAHFGSSVAGLHLDLILPLGISFYTLQTMSYTIDVYRGQMRPVKHVGDFALYVCFFPQLVAGPIERAPRLIPQICGKRRIGPRDLHEGGALAGWGVFKKVVIADSLAKLVDPVYAVGADPSGFQILVATYAFTLQIYADFSAYSDIARGTARMLGIQLMLNFDTPYLARDMGEFWRRWHISLSTWLRDYVYIPLGGNRRGRFRANVNLFLTLFIAGLWHGSNGTFIAFGIYHGILVVLVREYRRFRAAGPGISWVGAFITVHLWAFGMIFFRAQTMDQAISLVNGLATGFSPDVASLLNLARLMLLATPLMIFDLLHRRSGNDLFLLRWNPVLRFAVYLVAIHLILLFGRSDGIEFIYFQF